MIKLKFYDYVFLNCIELCLAHFVISCFDLTIDSHFIKTHSLLLMDHLIIKLYHSLKMEKVL